MAGSALSYSKGAVVGKGTWGSVRLGTIEKSGRKVAIKEIHRSMERYEDGVNFSVLREIKILMELKHRHVVELFDVRVTADGLELVLEYCETDLKRVVEDRRRVKAIRYEDAKGIMQQLLRGMHFLHSNWILHRDLKPDNILITAQGILKIADFGLARYFGNPNETLSPGMQVITRQYRPPELLLGSRVYGPPVDMWSIGCIMGEIRLRELLFRGDEDTDVSQLAKIFQVLGTPTDATWPWYTTLPDYPRYHITPQPVPDLARLLPSLRAEELALLQKLISLDPNRRPTAEEALDFDYFRVEPRATPPINLPLPLEEEGRVAGTGER
ncbi:Protein kinase, ATP binding site [Nannochloropsis gaditana]|uniref:Cyclin-dependent kinase 2 homolog n=1 Tax=Nannochloropsis gaditana TaxID=72520 RepID=W7TXV2_9STRA|nr:Protein kinase, ATP binding site [Nannochloropsis gaditana]